MERVFNALFLSRRNSARGRLAAALLNSMGRGRFRAFSAGVRPARSVDPLAVEVLAHAGLDLGETRARHRDEFIGENAPPLDFVFTLSDKMAGETPPEWPPQDVTAHWRCEDPGKFAAADPEKRLALIRARGELERRLRAFINLPVASLDRMTLQHMEKSEASEHEPPRRRDRHHN
jgi:protein-tyrosine-phosphatase